MSAPGIALSFIQPAASVLPYQAFDAVIGRFGVNLLWSKSHLCPCTYAGQIPGSPDPQCHACSGYGYYWDSAGCPFTGLITFVHLAPSPDEPGTIMSEKFGGIFKAEPTLTIPFSAPSQSLVAGGGLGDVLRDPNILLEADVFNLTSSTTTQEQVWVEASTNDIFVEVDAIDRFSSQLQVGGTMAVPYQQQLTIAASGAVTVYNTATNQVQFVNGYTVSGATVTLPASYPTGTPYVVEYTAAKAFVAWRVAGGIGHDRPFGQGITLPKRFRLQELDLWLKSSGKI